MSRNGKVILANGIKMDKNYRNVLAYTETQMYALVLENKTTDFLNCSFIRNENYVDLPVSYAIALKSNYMAFQNPDYSTKWFFAFIDSIEYLNDATTRIHYTIDVWSTWWDYWVAKECFIVRQHQNTDVAGDNTTPENVEHGEYVVNSKFESIYFRDNVYCVVGSVSGTFSGGTFTPSTGDAITKFGNMVMNGAVYVCSGIPTMYALIDRIQHVTTPEQGKVLDCYIAPKSLFKNLLPSTTPYVVNFADTSYGNAYTQSETIMNAKPTSISGVTPVNKKLLTYPYIYLLGSNNVGNTNVFRFEDFSSTGVVFNYFGIPTIGCSIIATPQNYKNQISNINESIIGGKYPTLGWREDSYTNWLTQNAVNNQVQQISSGGSVLLGSAMLVAGMFTGGMTAVAGAGLIANGVMSGIEASAEHYQHSIEPDSIKGLISSGDVLTSLAQLSFDYYTMGIKAEYVRRLDSYFTRYGYAQNKIMMPNIGTYSHRRNYSYVLIARDECVGVPRVVNNITLSSDDMLMINNIFRAGVSVWNNHTNLGDYSVANDIVTPSS